MSLFGNLYVGTSGLQTSQNSLNTVAHNLSNIGTTGYTRQQILQSDNRYTTLSTNYKSVSSMQTGLGVTYAQTRTVRDYFLDLSYRKESGRSAFYETSYNTLSEVETLLGELDGESFSTSLDNIYEALKELAKNPSSSVNQSLLITRASEFIERANSVYTSLESYQDNLNTQVKQGVDRINEISQRIYELNNDIVRIQSNGVEKANDLKDERDILLDELGKLGKITYTEDKEGAITVKFEGHQLVNRDQSYEIALNTAEGTGFYTPFWKLDAAKSVDAMGNVTYDASTAGVYNLTETISTAMDTDVGSIKAMLVARGDHRANYLDLQDADTYNESVSGSILMNIEAEFDNLMHNIVTSLNTVLEDAATAATAANPDSTYLRDAQGNALQLFTRISCEVGDAEDTTEGKENTLFTLGNLIVNPDLTKTPTLLGFTNDENEEDFLTAAALQKAFEEENYTLNPNVSTKSSLIDYYSNIVSQVANTGAVFKSVYDSETTTVESIEAARQQISGVSDDEELENMIKYQNAYNAASRYINVVDELLERIITTLGT